MKRLLLLALFLTTTALAGGAGPAPWNPVTSSIYDPSSSATAPYYLTVNSDGSINVNSSPAPSSASTIGVAPVASTAAESGHILKAAAGNLYALGVTIKSGPGTGNVLVFNSTTVPADGAVTPLKCFAIGFTDGSMDYTKTIPSYFGTGISVAYSSAASCFTKTASATAYFSWEVK